MQSETTCVLVVGGSLVGSSAALFLAESGVPSILIEKHAGSSAHPRAVGFTPRTIELLRSVGLEASIPAAPKSFRLVRARVESLAGEWFEQSHWSKAQHESSAAPEYSPSIGAAIAQDRLEPLLRDKARELGADIRMSSELIHFSQDADGVTALVQPRDGAAYTIRAAYMIAADGGKSPIRQQLGIGVSGRGHIRTLRSVLFRAPLEAYLERGVVQFEIDQPDFKAFLTTYGAGRWVLMFGDDAERDPLQLQAAIVKAIGRNDLPIEIITTGRWELGAVVADRFSSGRVFLAGDAAHCFPPTRGGYGANTGIHDVHNLAWKLAAVQRGSSTPALLESYDAERRPVAWVRHDQIFAHADYKAASGSTSPQPVIDDDAMELGQLYRSGAVIGAGPELPDALRPDAWAGQPGTRAPHLWITGGDEPRSTLDLVRGWLVLSEDPPMRDAALRVGKQLGITLSALQVGSDIHFGDAQTFRRAYGVHAGGTTLIRPDGHVAWRALDVTDDPDATLASVLRAVSSAAAAA